MKVFDKEINFSFTDVDNLEKIDKELKKIELEKDKVFDNYIEELKHTCIVIKTFFNEVLGEDITNNIPNDYELLISEFDKFTKLYLDENKKAGEKLKKNTGKYDIKRVRR